MRQLRDKADLKRPEEVKAAIADAKKKNGAPLCNQTKASLALAYTWFCRANDIEGWTPPKYKWNETIPIIPTKARVEKIIAASTKRFSLIFTLMAEIGAEGEELHRVHRNKIDLEQRIITIEGTKGHATANYKLKPTTAEMLREYLVMNPEEYPFPKPNIMSEMWRRVRTRVAANLKDPELTKIPMKNLRNYSGAQLYLSMPIRDPIAVMRHLRHKKIETTMHYIRAIVIDGEEDIEFTSKAVQTKEEAMKLIDAGFTLADTIDGYHIYRKRK